MGCGLEQGASYASGLICLGLVGKVTTSDLRVGRSEVLRNLRHHPQSQMDITPSSAWREERRRHWEVLDDLP